MDITQAYATAAGGIIVLFILVNSLSHIARLIKLVHSFTSVHLIHPYLLGRHRFLGPWTRAGVLAQLIHMTANLFSLSYGVSTISQAGLRAGTLSLINMIPLFAGPHLGFLADLLGVSVITYRRLHRSTGLVSFALFLFHILIVLGRGSLSVRTGRGLFGVIGGSSLCLLVLLSHPLLRKVSFEIFLRTHQALAALFLYSAWRHLPSDGLFPRLYVYLSAGLFSTTLLFQAASVLYRNRAFRHSRSRAMITQLHGAVKISIHLSKAVKVEPGQYINLWIPSVSFWAFLQSHPFVVTSWADGPQDTLELFVEPRKGLTRELLSHAETDGAGNAKSSRWALFSGPHGRSAAVGDFENVLMIADGFGIAAHLPYLKRLIHGYNARKVRARRIHLVWQLRDIDIGIAAQSLLNRALDDDTLDRGYILRISIYLESGNVQEVSFGRRATVYNGTASMRDILHTEVTGADPERAQKDLERLREDMTQGEKGKTLIMVSGTEQQRDDVRSLVRGYLKNGVKYLELEYQPKAH